MNEKELLTALGPLAPLYSDPAVLEIMVDTPDRVLVERGHKLEDAGIRFDSPETLRAVTDATLEDAGIQFDSPEALRAVIDATLALAGAQPAPGQTISDIRLTDVARMVVVLPPTAPHGPCLVIRKFSTAVLTWDKLIEFGAITREALDFLRSAVRAHVSILIAGGTASGKMTLASRLAEIIPAEERLVVVESVHEMEIRHPRAVFLEAAGPAELTMTDLLSAASKMRPDYIATGELYGPEAMRALELMSRGHSAMTTTHANSPEDALTRLETMCLMANLGLGLGEIRALIASALQLIVSHQRLPDGRRRVMQIVELRGLEDGRYVLQPLFRYNPAEDKLEPTGARPGWEPG